MKIQLPKTIAEPHTLRWDEIIRLSRRDKINLLLEISNTLDELCSDLNESKLFDKFTYDDLLFLLKKTTKQAGGIKIDATYKQVAEGESYHSGMRYDISFGVPPSSVRQTWFLEVMDRK